MTTDSINTRTSIIRRISEKDELAWHQFVDLYAPLIFQWCCRSSLSNEDSADVTQLVFEKLHRKISSYQPNGDSTFRSWLWVVTRNTIRDHVRKVSQAVSAEGGTECRQKMECIPALDELDDPTTDSLEQELYQRALAIIESNIESKTWQAFWKVTVEGRSTDEVAAEMDMSANGVRQAKSRVLRRLRDLLEE